MSTPSGSGAGGSADGQSGDAKPVTGLAAVTAALPFTLTAPASVAGLPQATVAELGSGGKSGALVTYGKGPGSVVVLEHAASAAGTGSGGGSGAGPGGGPGEGPLSLPTHTIADVSVQELEHRRRSVRASCPSPGRAVSYVVLESVAQSTAQAAAQALLQALRRSTEAPPIEVRGLVKTYGELTAVAGVDLTVNAGDVYGYLGPSVVLLQRPTSLRMMLGLIPADGLQREAVWRRPDADRGRVTWCRGVRRGSCLLSVPSAGRKNLEMLAAFGGGGAVGRIDEALQTVDLMGRRSQNRVGGYSRRMRTAAGHSRGAAARP